MAGSSSPFSPPLGGGGGGGCSFSDTGGGGIEAAPSEPRPLLLLVLPRSVKLALRPEPGLLIEPAYEKKVKGDGTYVATGNHEERGH